MYMRNSREARVAIESGAEIAGTAVDKAKRWGWDRGGDGTCRGYM